MTNALTAIFFGGALASASFAQAAPMVEAAWSRPAAQGSTGVGFMTLVNPGTKADALIAVQSPAAREVQVHLSSVSGGMASMQAVASTPLSAGGRVTFAPGGYHLMFLGLKRPLKVGDSLAATLVFASGARVTARFAVGLTAPGDVHHH